MVTSNIIIVILAALIGLVGYVTGFIVGRLYGREEIIEKRQEMGIDEEKEEEDPFDVFFKQ